MSDNHGNTPAAWTAVVLGLAAFIVAGIALMIGNWPMFWIGVALAPVALVVLKVMSKMGYGASH
ncbi:MAG: HGxxPAAW family protein [Marmoricola sp.]